MNTEMKNATEVFSGENQQKRVNKLVDDMTLFDDDLMSHVFDKYRSYRAHTSHYPWKRY